MKKILAGGIILFSLLGLTSVYAQNPSDVRSTTSNQQSNQIALMFVQTAKLGEIKESSKHPGYYRLTLTDVMPYITYFMQRPGRNSGVVPVQNFVKAWAVGPNNFSENNPNATIIAAQINGAINKNTAPIIATLSDPQYQPNKNILSFLIKPLHGQKLLYQEMSYQYLTVVIE